MLLCCWRAWLRWLAWPACPTPVCLRRARACVPCSADPINAAVGATYTIRVYQGTSSSVAYTFPSSGSYSAAGTYALSPLPAGDYQVVVVAANDFTTSGSEPTSLRSTTSVTVTPVGELNAVPGCAWQAWACGRGRAGQGATPPWRPRDPSPAAPLTALTAPPWRSSRHH